MEGLILLLLSTYLYFLVHFGLRENTRIKSVSLKGMMKLETLLIVLPLLFSMILTLFNWGSLSGPHNGALLLAFVIAPSALLVVLAEVIIFGFIRNSFTGIKALFLASSVFFYLWFTMKYGR